MLRIVFTIVLPLVLPTAIYLLWVRLANGPAADELVPRTALPSVWLAAAGVVLALAALVMTLHFGVSTPGTYVPPRWENGHIIPGHIEGRNEAGRAP